MQRKSQDELELLDMLHAWLKDLHRMGRRVSTDLQREVESVAAEVVAAGGTITDAFSAAKSVMRHPAHVSV